MIAVSVTLWAVGGFLSAYVLYQLLLFAANAWIADPVVTEPTTYRRFNVIVPAHDEELYLPRLLESLCAQNYPPDAYRVTVVADNCSDRTAEIARRFDVDVIERFDDQHRGKGFAVQWALEHIALDRFDAVAIVDGDSIVEQEFVRQLNLQMDRGDRVIQCYNGVANPAQSWFTRLMDVSRTIANDIVHPGKRKLGLSSHLMGNGMCFAVDVLKAFGWHAFSVGEDWEYYASLILNGVPVGYSRAARVYHQESVNLRQASSQRMRWSSGRFQVLRKFAVPLVVDGIRTADIRCIDAALPLVFPNPSLGINLTLLGMLASAIYALAAGRGIAIVALFTTLILLQLAMFLIGVLHTRDRAASALSLVLAPAFLIWKMAIDILSFCGVGTKEWKRTERRLS